MPKPQHPPLPRNAPLVYRAQARYLVMPLLSAVEGCEPVVIPCLSLVWLSKWRMPRHARPEEILHTFPLN